jgi:hypothetical protein
MGSGKTAEAEEAERDGKNPSTGVFHQTVERSAICFINSDPTARPGGGVGAVGFEEWHRRPGERTVSLHDRRRIVEPTGRIIGRQIRFSEDEIWSALTSISPYRDSSEKNFQFGTWEKALEKIDSVGVYKSTTSHKACPSCVTRCSMMTRVSEGRYRGSVLEGPEYETLGMFGSNQLIDDLPTVIQANILCDKLGLDTISAGNVIGFIMECFERGLISPREAEGDVASGTVNQPGAIERISLPEASGITKGEGRLRTHRKDSAHFIRQGMEFRPTPRGLRRRSILRRESGCLSSAAWPPAKS